MSAPHESTWGSINTCFEIGIEIYQLFCANKNGIAIEAERAKKILSDKALALGTEDNGFITFEEPNKSMIPTYELIKRGYINDDYSLQSSLFLENAPNLDYLESQGRYFVPEYFGQIQPPYEYKNAEQQQQLANGIYLVNFTKLSAIAIHKTVADYEISDLAQEYGKTMDNFLMYDSTTAAVPLYELMGMHEKVADIIVCKDSLIATLNENFPTYVATYNLTVPEEISIPNVSAPTELFLQRQLDTAAQSMDLTIETEQDRELELEM